MKRPCTVFVCVVTVGNEGEHALGICRVGVTTDRDTGATASVLNSQISLISTATAAVLQGCHVGLQCAHVALQGTNGCALACGDDGA